MFKISVFYVNASVYFFTCLSISKKNIDRGRLLKKIVEESGISIVTLVKRVGYKDRASYYAHIAKPDLSLEILFAYAKVLRYDLSAEFPEAVQFMAEDPIIDYGKKPKNFKEALDLIDRMKDRYAELLERHTRLLEQLRK